MTFVVVPTQQFQIVANRGAYRVSTGGPGLRGLPGADGGLQGVGVTKIVKLSQAAYDLLVPPDPTTFYIVTAT